MMRRERLIEDSLIITKHPQLDKKGDEKIVFLADFIIEYLHITDDIIDINIKFSYIKATYFLSDFAIAMVLISSRERVKEKFDVDPTTFKYKINNEQCYINIMLTLPVKNPNNKFLEALEALSTFVSLWTADNLGFNIKKELIPTSEDYKTITFFSWGQDYTRFWNQYKNALHLVKRDNTEYFFKVANYPKRDVLISYENLPLIYRVFRYIDKVVDELKGDKMLSKAFEFPEYMSFGLDQDSPSCLSKGIPTYIEEQQEKYQRPWRTYAELFF